MDSDEASGALDALKPLVHRVDAEQVTSARSDVPDDDLVASLRVGDGTALSSLYDRYAGTVDDMIPQGPTPSPVLLAHHKEQLMRTIMSETTSTPGNRRPLRIAAISRIAVLALAGGGVAVAGGKGVFRQSNGVVAIDPSALAPAYRGHVISAEELQQLQDHGKATVSANNRELACQHVTLYFDTDAELKDYQKQWNVRHTAALQAQDAQSTDADPCAAYSSSPRFVHDE